MAKLKKYNLEGTEIGEVDINDAFASAEINGQVVKDYIVAIRENKRQWSANTKGRSEVKHTTKKPRPQKGTGGARQGTLVASQHRGGGVVFGPKPKFDQHVRINKKERQAVIRFLIGEKVRNGDISVLEDTLMDAPKTKTVVEFMKKCELSKRVLFLGESGKMSAKTEDLEVTVTVKNPKHENFKKSISNLEKTEFSLAQNINGYDVMLANKIVMTEAAMKELENWLCTAK
ncbi:MAG: 50S ribosomal protein L4 [Chlamydiota bacterium]|nr:50S ribosomal protein L4 [Chlamydiota bacterium]